MKKRTPFHPLLFAAFPVLSLFAANLDFAKLADVWRPLAIMVGATAIIWLVVAKAMKDSARAAIGVTSFVAAMFAFRMIGESLVPFGSEWPIALAAVPVALVAGVLLGRSRKLRLWRTAASVTLAAVLLAGLAIGAMFVPWAGENAVSLAAVLWGALAGYAGGRIKKGVQPATVLLNLIGIFLVAQPLVNAALEGYGVDSPLAGGFGSPVRAADGMPDVYYIVLDGYGRRDALAEFYGITDDPLAKGLEERGFYVAQASRTNYTQTLQSLGSTLNMEYLHELLEVSANEESRDALKRLTDSSLVAARFRAGGYKFVSIVTYSSMLPTASAEVVHENQHGPSLLEEAFIGSIPFGSTLESTGVANNHRIRVLSAYRSLDELARSRRPQFVLVHIIAPHPPFVFTADGGPTENITEHKDASHYMEIGGTLESYVGGYRAQAEYIAKRTLESIDKLLARPGPRRCIIVQGDHGRKARLDYESLERSDLTESLPILNAYLVPQKMESELYASISPVNTFRIVLSHLFEPDYEVLPDKSYYSRWSRPYEFTEVPVD